MQKIPESVSQLQKMRILALGTSGDDIQEDETTPEDDKMDYPPPAKKQKNTDHSDQKGVSADVVSKKVGMYLCLV